MSTRDDEHVCVTKSYISCGIAEAYQFGEDAKKALYKIANYFFHPSSHDKAAFLIFSGTKGGNAQRCAELIQSLFGGVTVSDSVDNPNTGNIIQLWTWVIPHEQVRNWYREERINKLKQV